MKVLETERLILRRLTEADDSFIFELVNQPSWLEFIGDKGVRSLADARDYIRKGPLDMYERYGFGMYLVELKHIGTPMGMCGLIKRDALPDADVGFAFLPEYWGKGYAYEAAAAVVGYAGRVLGLERVLAITSLHNDSSIRLLEKIGLRFQQVMSLAPKDQVKLFAKELAGSG